jgi:hypothetical protein
MTDMRRSKGREEMANPRHKRATAQAAQHLDAVRGFAANAAIVEDVGQLGVFPADYQLIRHVRHRGARSADGVLENGLARAK